jgi:hypothetical protein
MQEKQEGRAHCSYRDDVGNSGKSPRFKCTDDDAGTIPGICVSLLTMLVGGLVSIICIALVARLANLMLQILILIYLRKS